MNRRAEILEDPIGSYPFATVACFDPTTGELPRRQLDHERNHLFIKRLSEVDVPAVLIAASTGHGHLRTVNELGEWFESAARAETASTLLCGLLRPEDGQAANRELIDLLDRLDYSVAFFRPGTDLDPNASDDQIAASLTGHLEYAASIGMPVGLYSISDVSGVKLTAEAVSTLVRQFGNIIVAAKVTEADYESSTLQFLRHPELKRLKIVQGWDPHLSQALRDGPLNDEQQRQRVGITSGAMSFAVFQYIEIFEAVDRQDWDTVAALERPITQLFSAMQDDPNRFADLQRAKYVMGLGHPLTGEVTGDQVRGLLDALESIEDVASRARLAESLDLIGDGPFHDRLSRFQMV